MIQMQAEIWEPLLEGIEETGRERDGEVLGPWTKQKQALEAIDIPWGEASAWTKPVGMEQRGWANNIIKNKVDILGIC